MKMNPFMRSVPLCALLLLRCGPSFCGEKLKVVMVAVGTIDLPLAYAMKEGCLAERGLAVEPIKVMAGATAVLAAGESDLLISALGPVLSACKNGAGIRVAAFLPPMLDTSAISRFPPQQASKIRTVALNSAGVGARGVVLPFLDDLGLDPGKIAIVIGKGDDVRYMMLKMGYADFFVTHSQELIRRVSAEKEFYVIPDSSGGRRMDARVLSVNARVLKKRGAAIEKFVEAMLCAVNSAAANPGKMARLLMEEYGYTLEEAETYAAKFTAAAKGQGFVPVASGAAESWKFVEEATEADRASTARFLFPDYALKAALK